MLAPRNSRALVVSINDYRLMDPSGETDLRGCLNDGMDYCRLFKWLGFKEIRWLRDKEATAEAIKDACRWLQEGTRWDGPLDHPDRPWRALSFSGHGTLYKGRPALVPADLRPDWTNALTFPKLGEVLAFPETTNVVAFLDCCHSGARMRNHLKDPFGEFMGPSTRARFIAPPEEQQAFGEMSASGDRVFAKSDSKYHLTSETNIVLTGCQAAQTSADAWIDNHFCGAFTWSLMRLIETTQGDLTYDELIGRSNAMLRARSLDQIPTFQGPPEYSVVRFMRPPFVGVDDGVADAQPAAGAA